MQLKTEKAFVMYMNAEEAGVMLSLLDMIVGQKDSLGRTVTSSMYYALSNAGVVAVDTLELTWKSMPNKLITDALQMKNAHKKLVVGYVDCAWTPKIPDACPFCSGERCNKCGAGGIGFTGHCNHDSLERHEIKRE